MFTIRHNMTKKYIINVTEQFRILGWLSVIIGNGWYTPLALVTKSFGKFSYSLFKVVYKCTLCLKKGAAEL